MWQQPYRPKLHLSKSWAEKLANIIGYAALLFTILFIFSKWGTLPEEVPMHFNFQGEVNRYGSKFEMLILPIISVGTFILLQVLENKPHLHNYPERLNETNVEQFYRLSKKMINYTKNVCALLFAVICFDIISIALGSDYAALNYVTIGLIVLLFVIVIVGLIKTMKIK